MRGLGATYLGSFGAYEVRTTLVNQQHELLFSLANAGTDAVFYVFPFYVATTLLQPDVLDSFRIRSSDESAAPGPRADKLESRTYRLAGVTGC